MKTRYLFTIICAVFAITLINAQSKQDVSNFFVGTYTSGSSEGIYKYAMHADGTLESISLVAKTRNPSFLAVTHDKKFLLSISEVSESDRTGQVQSYRITDKGLELVSESSSEGGSQCFIGVNKQGNVLTASYGDGNISSFKVDKNGELSEALDLKQHTGSDITERQKGPHAHSAWFDPINNNAIAADLGTNDLWIYSINEKTGKLTPADPPILSMEPGAGPRHLDFHPNEKWIYVINELNSSVSLVKRSGKDQYKLTVSYTTLPADFEGKNKCADIHVSHDGKYLYASNRGHNSLAIFEIDQKDGTLTPKGYESVRGETPRNFAISPDGDFVLVANQDSGNIVSFKRNKQTGQLKFIDEISAPHPVCLKFY